MISFLNPWFLLLTPLAAGPIVLHLLSRRKMKRTEFSSIFFLRKLRDSRFRWLNLRDILLLILRSLFLLFLVFALSGPMWSSRFPLARSRTSTIIILDDSYSTSARFDDLKNTACRIIDDLTADSKLAFLTPSGASWDTAWSNPRHVQPRIQEMTVSSSGRDLSASYSAALGIIGNEDVRVVIVSDGQKHALEFLSDVNIPDNVELICFLDNRKEPDNTAITSTSLYPRIAMPDEEQNLSVNIASNGESKRDMVYLWADQQPIEKKMISIAGQETIVNFILPRGTEYIKVELEEDSIPVDNLRYAVGSGGKLRVALVGNSDSRFLRLALEAGSNIEVEQISPSAVARLSPSLFDLVIWDGSAASVNQLQSTSVRGVGNLVLFDKGFPDYTAWAVTLTPGFENITFSELFSDFPPADLRDIRVTKYAKVASNPDNIHMYLSGGAPLFFSDSTGAIHYFATRFTEEHTDLVNRALFPVMVQRIVSFASGSRADRERYVGDTLELKIVTGDRLLVETPELSYEITPYHTERGYHVDFAQTHIPGFYRIGDEAFVVNTDPRESDLTRIQTNSLEDRGIKVYPLHKSIPLKLWFPVLILAALCLLAELAIIFL